MQKSGMHQSSG